MIDMLRMDHIVVSCEKLEAGVAYVEEVLETEEQTYRERVESLKSSTTFLFSKCQNKTDQLTPRERFSCA